MIKKVLATAAVAASVVGVTGVAATPALANNDDIGNTTANGNGSMQKYGNTTTGGYMSPNMSLINGSLNKPCVALPPKVDVQDVVDVGIVNTIASVQDIATQTNNQSCTENSSQVQGDAPLSHLLEEVGLLSQNGAGNNH